MATGQHAGVRFSSFLAVAIFAAALAAPAARAGLILTLTETGFAPLPVTDNGAGDGDLAVGVIHFNGAYGHFSTNISLAISNSPGAPDSGRLEIQSRDTHMIADVGQRTLTVAASDTSFVLPGAPLELLELHSTISGTITKAGADDAVTFQSFADSLNAQPPANASTTPQNFIFAASNPTVGFSDDIGQNTLFPRGAGPYSLGSVTSVTISPATTVNFSGTTETFPTGVFVPEPTGVAACVIAGPLLLARRRRRQLI